MAYLNKPTYKEILRWFLYSLNKGFKSETNVVRFLDFFIRWFRYGLNKGCNLYNQRIN